MATTLTQPWGWISIKLDAGTMQEGCLVAMWAETSHYKVGKGVTSLLLGRALYNDLQVVKVFFGPAR